MSAGRQGCVFCAIVRGEESAHVVAETDDCVVFLDRTPLFPGHLLVVPREHHETLDELPARLVTPLFLVARRGAALMETVLGAEGSFVAMNNRVSQSVPHLHIHVVPRRRRDGLKGFFWPRHKYRDDAHAASTAALLRSAWGD